GIGPIFARRLVTTFSDTVFEIIEKEPQRLLQVEGIGPKRAERIIAGWSDQKVIREIMAFLQGHGVSTSRAVRIYKTYGADAIPLVTENPYCRWTRGRQNHFGQFAAKDSSSEGGVGGVVRPDGAGGEAAGREHGIDRQDHSSLARGGSEARWIQERRGQSAGMRTSGCRRDFDGGCAADGFAHKSAAAQFGPGSGRRRGPATVSRSGTGAGRHH